jgi:thymidine kinase
MYSGKSTALLYQLKRAELANKEVVLFKPRIDDRYSANKVVSHDGYSFPATVIDSHKEIVGNIGSAKVVGIDEVQFFDPDIWRVIDMLSVMGKTVVVAGLSTDFMGQPFETSARVAMIADKIEKLVAVCVVCGEDAVWTQMVIDGQAVTDGDRVQVGGSELYSPRCRKCFVR